MSPAIATMDSATSARLMVTASCLYYSLTGGVLCNLCRVLRLPEGGEDGRLDELDEPLVTVDAALHVDGDGGTASASSNHRTRYYCPALTRHEELWSLLPDYGRATRRDVPAACHLRHGTRRPCRRLRACRLNVLKGLTEGCGRVFQRVCLSLNRACQLLL